MYEEALYYLLGEEKYLGKTDWRADNVATKFDYHKKKNKYSFLCDKENTPQPIISIRELFLDHFHVVGVTRKQDQSKQGTVGEILSLSSPNSKEGGVPSLDN